MPTVRVELLKGRSREQKQEFAQTVTLEGARILRCAPADIQVVFTDIEPGDWAVAGRFAGEATSAPDEP